MYKRFVSLNLDHANMLIQAGPAMDWLFQPEQEQRRWFTGVVVELIDLLGKDAALDILGDDTDWKHAIEASDVDGALQDVSTDVLRRMLAFVSEAIALDILGEWIRSAKKIKDMAQSIQENINAFARECRGDD